RRAAPAAAHAGTSQGAEPLAMRTARGEVLDRAGWEWSVMWCFRRGAWRPLPGSKGAGACTGSSLDGRAAGGGPARPAAEAHEGGCYCTESSASSVRATELMQ